MRQYFDFTRFQDVADALNQSGPFVDGGCIVAHPREPEPKLKKRQEIAIFSNMLHRACAEFVDDIGAKPPTRDTGGSDAYQSIIDDADMRGNSLSVFFNSFMIEAKARGCVALLIDMPKKIGQTLGDQKTGRLYPYLVPVMPESIKELEMDARGNVNKIAFSGIESERFVTRTWTKTTWSVQYDSNAPEQGEHNLGIVPVVLFSESLSFPHLGGFSDIAKIMRRWINVQSEHDEILRAQTFSILNVQVPSALRGNVKALDFAGSVGTDNLLITYDMPAAYIAPPDGPAATLAARSAELVAMVNEIAMRISEPNQAESGQSRRLRFQQRNAALTRFAVRFEDFERRIWAVIAKWLGVNALPEVQWQKDYALDDVQALLEQASAAQALGMPPAFMAALRKKIAVAMLSDAPQADIETIMQEIDEVKQEREPADDTDQDNPEPN